MPAPLPASVPDTQLGLSTAEIHLLRQHQQQALGPYAASHHGSTSSSRGRGQSRSSGSGSTSRAGSAGTSHGQGRLMLDAGSLAVLGAHFERLMARIQERVDYVGLCFPLSTRPEKIWYQVDTLCSCKTSSTCWGGPQSPLRPMLMISCVLALGPN